MNRVWWTIAQHEEKALPFEWYNPETGLLYDFSVGGVYTMKFQLVKLDQAAFTKNGPTGFVGAATAPNMLVRIGAGELVTASVAPGLYEAWLTAHHNVNNTDDIFRLDDLPIIEIIATPA